jgi:nucleolar protein 9
VFLVTLLRSPSSSYFLQSLLNLLPYPVFSSIYNSEVFPSFLRLASHPIANFVVASCISRLKEDELRAAMKVLQSEEGKDKMKVWLEERKVGVLKGFVNRVGQLEGRCGEEMAKLLISGFGCDIEDDGKDDGELLGCVLGLMDVEVSFSDLSLNEVIPNYLQGLSLYFARVIYHHNPRFAHLAILAYTPTRDQ